MFKLLTAAFLLIGIAIPAQSRTTNYRIFMNQVERHATIHIPDRIVEQQTQAPVLFVFHDQGSGPTIIERQSRLLRKADREGFVVVFPSGHMREGLKGRYWNVAPFQAGDQDFKLMSDLEFIDRILAHLKTENVLDSARVFAAGFSMGGMMAYRLGCEKSEIFSALVSVGGAMTTPDCNPSHPVSVLHLHGFEDTRIPYLGGKSKKLGTSDKDQENHDFASDVDWPDTMSEIRAWTRRLSCKAEEPVNPDSDTLCQSYQCNAGARVKTCLSFTAGHEWMGWNYRLGENRASGDRSMMPKLDASSELMDFLTSLAPRKLSEVP